VRLWLALAGLNGLIGVAAGAWAWHGPLDDGARAMASMGAQFQLFHALALTAVAWLATRQGFPRYAVVVAGTGFTLGILLFSGSLYALAAFGAVPVRGAAPVGGFALMLGWATLLVASVLPPRRSPPHSR
jgi:uncharacterized membrane protein YgdD (TMEM256/DUF423 family)